ncbi:MAG: hemolysin family protein [Candidatus Izemoplasmatales bacterium]|jgi:putative hemolysin|nr:hemolysin family protein [Candidatus Izemoplasmatales bacterium]
MEDVYILILVFILILINGFFAASEMALVSINPNKLQKLVDEGNKKAKKLQTLSKDSTRYLSTIQVAITLAGFLSSAIAGSNLAQNLVDATANIGINLSFNFAVVLITLVLSFITLVFGELVPKRIALNSPITVAMLSIGVLKIMMFITRPAVWLLTITTNGVVKLLGIKKDESLDKTSEDEIKQMIRSGHMQGLYKGQEKEMLENIFEFDDIHAETIMTPRTDIYAIDINEDKQDIIQMIIEAPYTRIPFFNKTIDNLVGIIHVKDVLIEAKKKNFSRVDYKKLLREPFYAPNNIKINVLFRRMQKENHQIAILLDSYGGIDGIITLEDILEEIVGNIYDEFDESDKSIKKIDEKVYIVDGLIQIQDFNRYFKVDINDDPETLSGLIIERIGYIPDKLTEEEFVIENLSIRIKTLKKNYIDKFVVKVND